MSGSQDCTIKIWDLPDILPGLGVEPALLTARNTEKAHDKVSHCFECFLCYNSACEFLSNAFADHLLFYFMEENFLGKKEIVSSIRQAFVSQTENECFVHV